MTTLDDSRGGPAMTRRHLLTLAAAWTLSPGALWGGRSAHPQRLILNTAFGPPVSTPDRTGFFDRLMSAVFDTLGHAVTTQTPPAERALILANDGVDDGDGPRVPFLDTRSEYSNLIRVQEPLFDVAFCAYTLDPSIVIHDWKGLEGYQLGIVTGWKILEQRLQGHLSVVKVRDPARLFMLLKHGRAEIVVIDRYSGVEAARRLGMHGIRMLRPALEVTPMYLFLNARHRELATLVSEELRAMKRDGRYQAIYQETLGYVDEQYPADHD